VRTLERMSIEAAVPLAHDSLEIYGPLAQMLGLWPIQAEIEDCGFRLLEPEEYYRIQSAIDNLFPNRQGYLDELWIELKTILDNQDINAEVIPRFKHNYSIYRK